MIKQRKYNLNLYDTVLTAIKKGDLAKLKNLVENENYPITNLDFESAVTYSQLEILSYFLKKNHSPSAWPYAIQQAAMEGKINFLEYTYKYILNNINDYSDQDIYSFFIHYGLGTALSNNQLETAKFLYNLLF